jgi:very-short-patch-repair endonuclease
MMLCALCIICHENAASVRYRVYEHEFGDLEQILDSFQIEPQAVIERYRVDFRLTY